MFWCTLVHDRNRCEEARTAVLPNLAQAAVIFAFTSSRFALMSTWHAHKRTGALGSAPSALLTFDLAQLLCHSAASLLICSLFLLSCLFALPPPPSLPPSSPRPAPRRLAPPHFLTWLCCGTHGWGLGLRLGHLCEQRGRGATVAARGQRRGSAETFRPTKFSGDHVRSTSLRELIQAFGGRGIHSWRTGAAARRTATGQSGCVNQ